MTESTHVLQHAYSFDNKTTELSFLEKLCHSFFATFAFFGRVCPVPINVDQSLCPLMIAWSGLCPFDRPLCTGYLDIHDHPELHFVHASIDLAIVVVG